jgi:hypothetical protein
MRTLLILLIPAALLFGCRQKASESDQAATETKPQRGPVQFETAVADLRLRETPGEKGVIVATLPKGARLEDLGEVSDFTTRVTLRGITFDEPWIKVKTSTGQTGWVYGGGLIFDASQNSTSTRTLLQKRAIAVLGQPLVERINEHRRDWAATRTEADLARLLDRSMALRDTLSEVLQKRIPPNSAEDMPDMFWLAELFTGFQPQLVAEGTAYHLFCDYRQWLALSKKSNGIQDDIFIDLQIAAFPDDSIEYFFPAWQIQTWDYGGHCMLGSGVCKDLLGKINAQSGPGALFEQPLQTMKTRIVSDLTQAETSFWHTAAEAGSELEAILKAKFKVLSQADVVALSTLQERLKDPAKYGIVTGQRNGN